MQCWQDLGVLYLVHIKRMWLYIGLEKYCFTKCYFKPLLAPEVSHFQFCTKAQSTLDPISCANSLQNDVIMVIIGLWMDYKSVCWESKYPKYSFESPKKIKMEGWDKGWTGQSLDRLFSHIIYLFTHWHRHSKENEKYVTPFRPKIRSRILLFCCYFCSLLFYVQLRARSMLL